MIQGMFDRRRHIFSQRLLHIILLCVGLLWISPSVWASANPSPNVEFHLLRPGTVAFGDFDGDQIPDVASGTNLGRTEQGYAYRVDLDLTNSRSQPFRVFSCEPNGLDIRAIDVDGDHDLDLVITSRLLQQPVGVWLNDGRGNFTPGSSLQFSSAFSNATPALTSSLPTSGWIACREPRQPQMVLESCRIAVNLLQLADRALPVSFRDSLVYSESARFRAPPAASRF